MPVVIATSSIALQRALATDYIPEISRILMDHGIIRTPLTFAIRKGKEHYLCEKRLRAFYSDADAETQAILKPLLSASASCDMANSEGLTPYMKRHICVTGGCGINCPCYSRCRYLSYREAANDPRIDFQITNHNYFLADILHLAGGKRPLMPRYQLTIIDEAHKFLSAARQMYGLELSDAELPALADGIRRIIDCESAFGRSVHRLTYKMQEKWGQLFRLLRANAVYTDDYEESGRFPAIMDTMTARLMKNITGIADDLIFALENNSVKARYLEQKMSVIRQLQKFSEIAKGFARHENLICWLEQPEDGAKNVTALRAIPKNLAERLYTDVWSMGVPMILTSGTLSASGDFTRIKHSLGLDRIDARKLSTTSLPSPFNYKKNLLLYISNKVPFPDQNNKGYIAAVADEVERLVRASHGHAAVLFTSYNAMGKVYAVLEKRGLQFPLFKMARQDTNALERFKQSGNGILFAAGAMWEGIDIPGDALSMLIIVKLPFAAPDPIGDYEFRFQRRRAGRMIKNISGEIAEKRCTNWFRTL